MKTMFNSSTMCKVEARRSTIRSEDQIQEPEKRRKKCIKSSRDGELAIIVECNKK